MSRVGKHPVAIPGGVDQQRIAVYAESAMPCREVHVIATQPGSPVHPVPVDIIEIQQGFVDKGITVRLSGHSRKVAGAANRENLFTKQFTAAVARPFTVSMNHRKLDVFTKAIRFIVRSQQPY